MPKQGQNTQSIYTDENHYNAVSAGVKAVNDPNDTRTQEVIARSVGISQSSLQRFAQEQKDGNFPASFQDAWKQGRGMGGGDSELRVFAMNNIDVEDIGGGLKSQLFRKFVDHFPDRKEGTVARSNGMMTVRRIIKRLRKQREERAALAAEASVDNESSDEEGPERDEGDFL